MKIAVLGASGMLGHKLSQVLSEKHEVYGFVRDRGSLLESAGILGAEHLVGGIDVREFETVRAALAKIAPDVVCNAVGLVKQLDDSKIGSMSIEINSLLPHRLSELGSEMGFRTILFSTDCVFDGVKGGYSEEDTPNATDLYGASKALGEVRNSDRTLVIRSSIIGRELRDGKSLIEWFLSNRAGKVKGFSSAIYSGLTTLEMASLVDKIVVDYPDLHGIWNVSSEPIDKHSLLELINESLELEIEIEEDEDFRIDRSLDSTKFRNETGYLPPTWTEMIAEFAKDAGQYDKWRKLNS